MSAPTIARVLRRTIRAASQTVVRAQAISKVTGPRLTAISRQVPPAPRCLSISSPRKAGMMPDTHDPQPPNTDVSPEHQTAPADINEEEYHEHADRYMEALHERAEELQEGRDDVEVEYAVSTQIHKDV
jgi:frataxin